MTLVAIALKGDRAEVLTDSLSYLTGTSATIGRCSKARALPHLDAVMMGQGLAPVDGFIARVHDDPSLSSGGFDGFAERVPGALNRMLGDVDPRLIKAEIFLVGYSRSARRAVGWWYPSRAGWEQRPLPAFTCLPTPRGYEFSEAEVEQLAEWAREVAGRPVAVNMPSLPTYPAPSTDDEWVALGELVRATRAMVDSSFKVNGQACPTKWPIGGELFLTTVGPGSIATRRLHTWSDESEETLRQLFRGTLHPVIQQDPCGCGSGAPWIECCAIPQLGHPCPCGSGATFGRCCSVRSGR